MTELAQPDHDALGRAVGSLRDQLADLIALFVDAGHRLYVVGGWVRDHLLAQPHSTKPLTELDVDLTTDALPDQTTKLLERWSSTLWLAGITFGTVGATRDGVLVEVTTHRAEQYDPHSRNPQVRFSDDITVDLSRRDFTVNAMAVELPGGALIDPFDGAADLAARRLRTPSEPHGLFRDDPLRILRAARFAAALDLQADPAVVTAMAAERSRLEIVTAERRALEVTKLLTLPAPGRGVELLARTDVLPDVVPSLRTVDPAVLAKRVDRLSVDQPSVDRLAHGDEVLVALRLAALMFDAPDAQLRDTHLRLSLNVVNLTRSLTDGANDLIAVDGSDPSLRRVLSRHPDTFSLVADLLAAVDAPVEPDTLARLIELNQLEGPPALRHPLTGDDVKRLASEHNVVIAGKDIGDALAFVLERRIEFGPLSVTEAQTALLQHWRADSDGSLRGPS